MLIKTNKIIVIEAESVSPSLHTWTKESKNLVGTSMAMRTLELVQPFFTSFEF